MHPYHDDHKQCRKQRSSHIHWPAEEKRPTVKNECQNTAIWIQEIKMNFQVSKATDIRIMILHMFRNWRTPFQSITSWLHKARKALGPCTLPVFIDERNVWRPCAAIKHLEECEEGSAKSLNHHVNIHRQTLFPFNFEWKNFLQSEHLSKDENSCGSISPKKVTAKTDAVITQNQCRPLISNFQGRDLKVTSKKCL